MTCQRRVYLMRHAEVRYVSAPGKRVRPENAPLTESGRRQARQTGRALARVPFDRAVCSGLPRTLETARLVLGDRCLSVEEREAFVEIRPGRLSDIPAGEFESAFLGALDAPSSAEQRFLGGETWGEMRDRVTHEFGAILSEPGWRHLLLVAHGAVNRVLLSETLGGGLGMIDRIEQDPGAINILDVRPGAKLLLRLLNHTAYDETKAELVETTMETLYRDIREAQTSPPAPGEQVAPRLAGLDTGEVSS